ncbi:hypothetical protein BO79DRAFT_233000 [Aspergillus costaricaensis CBS 115574]|uniref:Uncharacterized protein n=1 Tax=Aspergillus costaricaensis CBS 115574 TaxID=1448317 RepID=A0ACD1I0Q6_9EURO|nr:hypothetical protein BO79DRAFT_233000 [Aspergillus costaricaensis CBS 115574]RAK83805.1 hypothetical protein BO79DRAFT_233000 [Aspergillus costaricaensis CBS 115574]
MSFTYAVILDVPARTSSTGRGLNVPAVRPSKSIEASWLLVFLAQKGRPDQHMGWRPDKACRNKDGLPPSQCTGCRRVNANECAREERPTKDLRGKGRLFARPPSSDLEYTGSRAKLGLARKNLVHDPYIGRGTASPGEDGEPKANSTHPMTTCHSWARGSRSNRQVIEDVSDSATDRPPPLQMNGW